MNTKMKVLSLALIGAFGYAGAAAAVCPAGPTIAQGGAWAGATQTQGAVSVVPTGLEATTPSACKLQAVLNTGAGSFASANVRDDSPQNEVHYRAQFLINTDAVTGLSSFGAVTVFSMQSQNAFPATGGTTSILKLTISGAAAGAKKLNIVTADAGKPNNISLASTALAAGTNRVEIEWVGANGTGAVNYWVNNTNSATPTGSIANLTNSGWVGVKTAYLGLAAPNGPFRTSNTAQNVFFDAFDSRRQTFIGG